MVKRSIFELGGSEDQKVRLQSRFSEIVSLIQARDFYYKIRGMSTKFIRVNSFELESILVSDLVVTWAKQSILKAGATGTDTYRVVYLHLGC